MDLTVKAVARREELITALNERRRAPAAVPDASPNPAEDPVELLAKLGKLRDAGVLTEEEFAAKKAELLGRM